jgi:hypothetical protein
MNDDAVFAKTPKGIEEIEKRTFGLHPRTRQVLIVVDGKRDRSAITDMLSTTGPDLDLVLTQLLKDGFLSLLNHQTEAAVAPKPVATPTMATPAAAAPSKSGDINIPSDPQERLKLARTFMINTTETFVGVFGSGLVKQLQQAKGLDDFRELVKTWEDAIASGANKKQAAELKTRLMALL